MCVCECRQLQLLADLSFPGPVNSFVDSGNNGLDGVRDALGGGELSD
jgi:hypothetical protein